MKKIYLYIGDGAVFACIANAYITLSRALQNNCEIITLRNKEFLQGHWLNDAKLLILPGGYDLPYVREIGKVGNDLIRKHLNNGGVFWGICAGAYYASAGIVFNEGLWSEINGPRDLALFKGISKGPLMQYVPGSTAGARALDVQDYMGNNFKMLYDGGNYFLNAKETDVEILLTYKMNNEAAMIRFNSGNGKVMLSGVHFEYSPDLISDEDKYLRKFVPDLIESNQYRLNLINLLINDL